MTAILKVNVCSLSQSEQSIIKGKRETELAFSFVSIKLKMLTTGLMDINLAETFGTCKLCRVKGSEETPAHLVFDCPYTWQGRADLHRVLLPVQTAANLEGSPRT